MRKVKDRPEVTAGRNWIRIQSQFCLLPRPGCSPSLPHLHLETAWELNQNWAHSLLPQNQGFTANDIPALSLPCTPLLCGHCAAQPSCLSPAAPQDRLATGECPMPGGAPKETRPRGNVSWLPLSLMQELRAPSEQRLLCSLVYSERAWQRPVAHSKLGQGPVQQSGAGQAWGHLVLAPPGPWAAFSAEGHQLLASSSDRAGL